MATYDSDDISLITRVEAGEGVIVTLGINSDSENVWLVSIDSDYAVDKYKTGNDSDFVMSVLQKTVFDRMDSDRAGQQALASFVITLNQRVFDFDSDQGVLIAANKADLDSDLAVVNLRLDSDETKIQTLSGRADQADSDIALFRAMLDSDSLKIQSNCTSIEDLIRRADENDSDHILFRQMLDSDTAFTQELSEKIAVIELLTDSDALDLVKVKADLDSDSKAIELIKRDVDSDARQMQTFINQFDSDGEILLKLDQADADIQVLKARNDADSDAGKNNDSDIELFRKKLLNNDSDHRVLNILLDSELPQLNRRIADAELRLDSDSHRIAAIQNVVDSDSNRLDQQVRDHDSDSVLLLSLRADLDSEILVVKILRADFDSESSAVGADQGNLDSDVAVLKTFVNRLDSDERQVQNLSVRLDVLEDRVDSEELSNWSRYHLIQDQIKLIEDSDYFDSDRTIRSVEIGGPRADSDIIDGVVTERTGNTLSRVSALEALMGIGAATTITKIAGDSDLNTINYEIPGKTVHASTAKVAWKIYGLGGNEIVKASFTVAVGSTREKVLWMLQYSVNHDSMAPEYLSRFLIDFDSSASTDDKIIFKFKEGFEDMLFEVKVTESVEKAIFTVLQ